MSKKQLFTLEFPVRCSPNILFEFLSTASGLQEWFADKVDEWENVFSFSWNGGEETCEVNLPVVISCQKGMAEQRIPNMRGIMAARTKPLKVVEPSEASATTSIKKFDIPVAKSGVKLVDPANMDELVKLLKEEAKVI